MSVTKLGEVPFEDLRIGDEIISCTGRPGWIGGLYPEGTLDPLGYVAEYGGHVLMLWRGDIGNGTWSLSYIADSKVEYVGRKAG